MNRVEFWSSVEYGTFQKGLLRALTALGWDAEGRFCVGQVDYWGAKTPLERLSLRARTYGAYPWQVWRHFRASRGRGVGVVCTNTFYAPLIAAAAAGRKGDPVVHWVFDLFPEVLTVAGIVRPGSVIERAIRRVVRAAFDRAATNVFLGERLRIHAERIFGPIPRSMVIPVGCDAEPFAGMPPAARPAGTPVSILYSGNLGRMHEFRTVVDAIKIGLPAGIRLQFRGNGPGFRELEAAIRALGVAGSVAFGDNLEESEWIHAMTAADVGLVTMRAGSEAVIMPSKTYSALAAGQAVLAVGPSDSDLDDTVNRHRCGWVVRPGDAAGLAALWRELAANPGELLRRRTAAWNAARSDYDQRVLASQWSAMLAATLRSN